MLVYFLVTLTFSLTKDNSVCWWSYKCGNISRPKSDLHTGDNSFILLFLSKCWVWLISVIHTIYLELLGACVSRASVCTKGLCNPLPLFEATRRMHFFLFQVLVKVLAVLFLKDATNEFPAALVLLQSCLLLIWPALDHFQGILTMVWEFPCKRVVLA